MFRIHLMVAVAVAAGVIGCAQCDTCDDFPTPCVGPNCGQAYGVPGDVLAPTMGRGGPAMMGTMAPIAEPAHDAAGPAPSTPAAEPSASVTPADVPSSPPPPMDPAAPPN